MPDVQALLAAFADTSLNGSVGCRVHSFTSSAHPFHLPEKQGENDASIVSGDGGQEPISHQSSRSGPTTRGYSLFKVGTYNYCADDLGFS
jgi:hypothetical protein